MYVHGGGGAGTYIEHGGLFLGVFNGPEHLVFDAEVRQVSHACDAIHLRPLIKRQVHEHTKHALHHRLLTEPFLVWIKTTCKVTHDRLFTHGSWLFSSGFS